MLKLYPKIKKGSTEWVHDPIGTRGGIPKGTFDDDDLKLKKSIKYSFPYEVKKDVKFTLRLFIEEPINEKGLSDFIHGIVNDCTFKPAVEQKLIGSFFYHLIELEKIFSDPTDMADIIWRKFYDPNNEKQFNSIFNTFKPGAEKQRGARTKTGKPARSKRYSIKETRKKIAKLYPDEKTLEALNRLGF